MVAKSSEKLTFITKLTYGAGDLGPAITANVLVFFLLYFFTQVAGLPPGLAGSILMIGKIADAINDPIIGMWSDRADSPWGRRLPWMFFGAIPFCLLFILQWIVPTFSTNDTINDWSLFAYYVLIGILFNIAFTAVNLPYTALTPELTQDYNERTSLNSFRFAFSLGGSILSLILAGLIIDAYPDQQQKQYFILGLIMAIISTIPIFWCSLSLQERDRKPLIASARKQPLSFVLFGISLICAIYGIFQFVQNNNLLLAVVGALLTILIGTFATTLFVQRNQPPVPSTPLPKQQNMSLPFSQQLKIVFNNRPFLFVIGIYLFSWLGVQLTASILPYFVVSWMGLPESAFPQTALAVQGTALVMLFVWGAVSKQVEKKVVYALGTGLWLIAQIGLFFLQPGQVGLMYGLAILAGFGVSVAYLIPWSMVPDVIELDELKTGQRREGIFYGFMVLLQKMGLALGLFLVGQSLEWAGFIESVPGQPPPQQPDSALFAIRIAIAPLPMVSLIGGLILAYFYPLTREVHQQICMELAEKREQ
ncbi:putative sodium/sugar (melibiose) symporter [Halothece sp. PCC 7418]|uniref:MFS transporter n=1 Tax=Halothece sp. (strain PCC 7418) TaxID=65093 RepID=UPI0002A0620B|nr:MFS transporter [Halothece sp. PCC 7418]AFZ44153.1 putative sodium/sugar (melibiose) symporter [Halothece sp. PCC 7418]